VGTVLQEALALSFDRLLMMMMMMMMMMIHNKKSCCGGSTIDGLLEALCSVTAVLL